MSLALLRLGLLQWHHGLQPLGKVCFAQVPLIHRGPERQLPPDFRRRQVLCFRRIACWGLLAVVARPGCCHPAAAGLVEEQHHRFAPELHLLCRCLLHQWVAEQRLRHLVGQELVRSAPSGRPKLPCHQQCDHKSVCVLHLRQHCFAALLQVALLAAGLVRAQQALQAALLSWWPAGRHSSSA